MYTWRVTAPRELIDLESDGLYAYLERYLESDGTERAYICTWRVTVCMHTWRVTAPREFKTTHCRITE